MNFFESLVKYAFSAEEFDPKPKYTVYPFSKKIAFDVDDTLNPKDTPNLFFLTLENLSKRYKKLYESLPDIFNLIKTAREKRNFNLLEDVSQKIVDCEIKRRDVYEACYKSARDFHFINNLHLALAFLRKLEYKIGLISGSFEEALYFLSKRFERKLGIEFYGSKLSYEGGILKRIDINVGSLKRMRGEEFFSDSKICICCTDDPIFDEDIIALSIQNNSPALLIGEKRMENYSLIKTSPLIIEAKSARDDAMIYPKLVTKFETILISLKLGEDEIEKGKQLIVGIKKEKDPAIFTKKVIELYERRKNYYFLEDMINYLLVPESIQTGKDFIKRRFIEAHLPEEWR